jgi:hypothetical protein
LYSRIAPASPPPPAPPAAATTTTATATTSAPTTPNWSPTAPAPQRDLAVFGQPAQNLRVSKTGRFAYTFGATRGRSDTAKLTSATAIRVGGEKRRLKIATKTLTSPANGEVKLKFKLSTTSLKMLRRVASLRFKVSVTLDSTVFTAALKLKVTDES